MGRFGQSVAESANSDSWILGFKDGVTRIRIVQEVPTWVKFTQHFSTTAFYFPHDKEAGDECIGCKYSEFFNDKTGEPKQQVQYAFNALDEDGKLRIFRLGIDAFKMMKSRHDRIGTVTDRDYNIVRSGKKLDTTYVPEPGDKYEVDLPSELLDIYTALGAKYDEAEAKILKKVQEEAAEGKEDGGSVSKESRVKEAEAAIERDLGDEPTVKKETTSSEVDFEDMGTPAIKTFLEERKVEIPPRAARAALIKLAEANKDTPPF